ncbi:gustatory receptor [Homalodisca vitripennis]|nr:gustatory receptor [Homalodisca vitripennis]
MPNHGHGFPPVKQAAVRLIRRFLHRGSLAVHSPFNETKNLSRQRARQKDDATTCIHFNQANKRSSRKLKSLMNTYWMMCDAVHQANDFYCDQLMAVMFSLFVHVTIKAYFFFLFLRAGEVFAMISEAAWVLVYVCYAILLVNSGTNVTNSADEMRLVICQSVNKDLKPSLRKQLEVFLLQLIHHNTKFSARGFFQIHNETLTSMAGAVTTYLVILIQFQTERQTT